MVIVIVLDSRDQNYRTRSCCSHVLSAVMRSSTEAVPVTCMSDSYPLSAGLHVTGAAAATTVRLLLDQD